SVFDQKVKVLEIRDPSRLAPIEVLRFSEIVGPFVEACHDSKHLLIINFIIAFCLV
ncbi:hypothetical protein AMATHDRAFT_156714, partial [Amanita thiersii Skay4041]